MKTINQLTVLWCMDILIDKLNLKIKAKLEFANVQFGNFGMNKNYDEYFSND